MLAPETKQKPKPKVKNDLLIEALQQQGVWADKALWQLAVDEGAGYELQTYTIQAGAALLGGSYNYEHHSVLLAGLIDLMHEDGRVERLVAPYVYKVPVHTRHLIKALTYAAIVCIHPKE